ncbi:hypothetical protein F4678DRAFT_314367 [Xylaria arbuscula]|nr:hypothetical protein F4678DRAFT_314367 [Xylaria arbuscula]
MINRPYMLVRMLYIRRLVILCGQWDDSQTDFHYAAIPIANHADIACRTNEIIISDSLSQNQFSGGQLSAMMGKYTIAPQLVSFPRTTDLMIRKHITTFQWSSRSHKDVDISLINGLIKSPKSLHATIFCYEYYPETQHRFVIAIIRPDALNHSHEDPAQGRECGKLRFGLHPVIISPESGPETVPLTILDKQSGALAAQKEFNVKTFRTIEAGQLHCFGDWKDIRYKHDMAVPRDEWSISIIGIVDIHIRVERVFLDEDDSDYETTEDDSDDETTEDDSDDETTEDESHRFVDVLDLVIRENSEKEDGVSCSVI